MSTVIVSVGVGVDGGGFIIINGKLKRIPPRVDKLLATAINIYAQAEAIDDKRFAQQVKSGAESIIQTSVQELVEGNVKA